MNTRWVRPSSVAEACEALSAEPDRARPVAGCTGVPPRALANDRNLEVAVDLLSVAELRAIENDGGRLRIGAAASVAELADADSGPLSACAAGIGDEVLRRQATVGGNLALGVAGPNEIATALLALGGTVEVAGSGGRRVLAAEELAGTAAELEPGEVLVALEAGPAGPWAYRKLTTNARSYVVGSAAAHRTPAGVRVVANAGAGACRLDQVERALEAGVGTSELLAATVAAMATVPAATDALASAAYRRRALTATVAEVVAEVEEAGR